MLDDVPPSDDEEPIQLGLELSTEEPPRVYRLQPDSFKP